MNKFEIQQLISIYSELKILFCKEEFRQYPYPQAMNRLSDLITQSKRDFLHISSSSDERVMHILWEINQQNKMNIKIPRGYTEEELERDNPYNQWMYEDVEVSYRIDWANKKIILDPCHNYNNVEELLYDIQKSYPEVLETFKWELTDEDKLFIKNGAIG